jgi:hypothetical protein
MGAQADETSPDSVDEGDAGALRMTLDRLLKVQSVSPLRDVDVTFSVDTAIYASGDLLADSQIVAGAVRANDAKGMLVAFKLVDEDFQTAFDFDLLLFRVSTSLGAENAAISVTDAISRDQLGTVSVLSATNIPVAQALNRTYQIGPNHRDMPVPITPVVGTSDIYAALVLRSGTPTFTASGIRARFTFKDA